jgi:hypothetical protein
MRRIPHVHRDLPVATIWPAASLTVCRAVWLTAACAAAARRAACTASAATPRLTAAAAGSGRAATRSTGSA